MKRTKRILSFVLMLSVLFTCFACYAETENTDNGGMFTVVSVDYPGGEELFGKSYEKYSRLCARFSDDKTPIPLSMYYDGKMFATVPKFDANRVIEVFIGDEAVFTDYNDEHSFDFYYMKKLSISGVVNGDNEGKANPLSEITRAEATAMVMRFLGLPAVDGAESKFDDVKKDDWFCDVVASANKYGIVNGDSETKFSPERSISREEFVAIAARATYLAGLRSEDKSVTKENFADYRSVVAEDLDKVSDWAIPAYHTLGYNVPVDYEDGTELDAEGVPISIMFYRPSQNITRFEVSVVLARIQENYQVYPSSLAVQYGFDKEMPTIDGSTSTYPFTEAVYQNLFSNGYMHPQMPQKHSKSHASYERLINGDVDMIFASVYPASDVLELAKENGVEIELVPIAYDAMVFFTNIENSAENLTSEQITNIYVDNKYTNWNEIGGPDALLYPYCRNNDSGSHAQMERHFLNGKEINEKIRNETTSVSMSNVLTDVQGAITTDPAGYALGYSIYYYFNNMDMFYDTSKTLKLLAIDGVYPTDETIADGTYPLSNNTYIAYIKGSKGEERAKKMADFMLTDAGQMCVKYAGFGTLRPIDEDVD
ncbi:substrate-binding domain-containing protein [Qingrenia yutianensis]|uniref:Substrate-binding domain-containing protein n=1 Tax=Qingrenia yutianensis TaxID=2763676 RepID=A0A926FCA2_9FIRM|nr:substrate-binding domain-containing protein [Qingrenia yutianensis]MBC8596627.1 substrate-binding domain-containing protein [Qingrenia yutianensis]